MFNVSGKSETDLVPFDRRNSCGFYILYKLSIHWHFIEIEAMLVELFGQ